MKILERTLLASALVALGCDASTHAPAAREPAPVRAQLARAERALAPITIEIAGTVEAERSATVSTRVMAVVTAVHARLGDTVRQGEPLISIDPTAVEGQAAQAEGGLAQAEAALVLAERNFQRYTSLAATDAASALELDLARLELDRTRGAVAQARGAVAAARSLAGESQLVAPFAGRVSARLVEIGDLAAPGRPLLRLDSTAGRRLAVEVPERLAAAAGLALGSRVAYSIDARPDLGRPSGEVVELAPGPDPTTHTLTARIALGEAELPAGAAGRARIAGERRESVLVPAAAVLAAGGLDLVVVRDGDGRARSRVVTTGATSDDGRVEILSGLVGDETLLVGLAAAPENGAAVEEIAP